MKADRKTTKPIFRGKSKTQEAPPTHFNSRFSHARFTPPSPENLF